MGRFRRFAVSLVGAAVALSGTALATTVTDFCMEDLVRFSHAGVRGRVLSVTPLGEHMRHRLQIVELLFGTVHGSEVDLDLLRSIEGMPALRPGDEVVVFLNFDNRVERIIGLKWGTYRIKDEHVFDHEWRAQRLVQESRAGETVTFLRALSPDKAGAMPYDAFERSVRDAHRRMMLRSPP